MSEEKPKVISFGSRKPYEPPAIPEEGKPVIDTASLATIKEAEQMIQSGEYTGLLLVTFREEDSQPQVFTQFRPGRLPKQEALAYIGMLRYLEDCLLDVAVHGLEALEEVYEEGDEE